MTIFRANMADKVVPLIVLQKLMCLFLDFHISTQMPTILEKVMNCSKKYKKFVQKWSFYSKRLILVKSTIWHFYVHYAIENGWFVLENIIDIIRC